MLLNLSWAPCGEVAACPGRAVVYGPFPVSAQLACVSPRQCVDDRTHPANDCVSTGRSAELRVAARAAAAAAGKDYRDSVLKDARSSLIVFAGGDPDLRQAVTDGKVEQVGRMTDYFLELEECTDVLCTLLPGLPAQCCTRLSLTARWSRWEYTRLACMYTAAFIVHALVSGVEKLWPLLRSTTHS
jgi:hypothetical protein